MNPDTLVIVFGAGGRLGARLLPRLTAKPISVLGIVRQDKPATWPSGLPWIQVDVTKPDEWPCSLDAMVGIARRHQRVVLADLLLSRGTVTAMRRSIAAVTAYILRLRDRLNVADLPCSLIVASTTAVLAPWLYQTPYGLAKRRQLRRYVTSGIPGVAFLLPSLVHTLTSAAEQPWPIWTYDQAAAQLASSTALRSVLPDRPVFQLVVPHPASSGKNDKQTHGEFRSALARSLPAHTRLLLNQRDSPDSYREASHCRLTLTPIRLRRYLDHHRVPPRLVRRLAELLATPETGEAARSDGCWTIEVGSSPTGFTDTSGVTLTDAG